MKMRKSAGAAPGRNAGERGNAWKSEDARCRKPERFHVKKMVRVPVHKSLGRAESFLVSVAVTAYGTIMAAPLWWHIDGLVVMGWWAIGCAGMYAVLRGVAVAPAIVKLMKRANAAIRMRQYAPEWLVPVESIRDRDTFGGYIPREMICEVARRGRT